MELKPIRQSFSVQYEYQLFFTQGLFQIGNSILLDVLKSYKKEAPIKLLFIIDSGVSEAHPELVSQIRNYCDLNSNHLIHTQSILVDGGEQVKNKTVIGGGAVIDMVGYAAAIAHRGVKLIRIPTTVLSQNDAAVGVKNSVNAFGKKNFLGTFAIPFAIINDSDFLTTLEQRDWISGIAEAIKVALIKDKDFFAYIAENASALKARKMDAMQYVIYKCAEMHMQHISQGGDPFESGSSRPLDFGHWAAHKLEHMTNYELRHGEAVAKGIALDITYAQLIGLISQEELQHILDVLLAIGFDITLPIQEEEIDALLKGIEEFREHLGGQLTITLISGIGKKHDVHEISLEIMKQAIEKLKAYAILK